MTNKTFLYICIGCTVVSCITCLIFALIGCWPGAINSPLTTVCLWGIYFLLGHIEGRKDSNRELIDLATRIISDNGKLQQQVRTLQAILEAKGIKEEEQTEQSQ